MTAIKERPILFSAPMVRAILEGRKTVTRRPIKAWQQPQIEDDGSWFAVAQRHPRWGFGVSGVDAKECATELARSGCCPYGRSGERLWVRETWAQPANLDPGPTVYRATYPDCLKDQGWENLPPSNAIRWKPSIHMFRRDSRILLEITDVRVERLQDISEDQAKAEGCFFTDYGQVCFHGGRGIRDATECEYPASKHQQRPGWMWDKTPSHEHCLDSARNAFGNLWQSVGGDWTANPWVWVVEFKRVTP